MVRLNHTHSLLNLQAKFFKILYFGQIYSELCKFHAIHPKFAPFANLLYIMFQAPAPAENPQESQRIMQIPRNSPT